MNVEMSKDIHKPEQLITEHIDIWTSSILAKSSSGRGSSKKYELYGIRKLRELILELAVRGKLVPQDANDEPASVLLEKIIEKTKRLNTVSDEEKLFDLPKGWVWVKFIDIYPLEYGKNLPKAKRSNTGEYKVYGSNGVVGSHNEKCVSSPCIVVGRKGSAGALNICLDNGCWVTDVAYSCIPAKGIDINFAFNHLQTLGLSNLGKGIKPGLNRNEAYSLVTVIPPLAEQHRIVAKVDELMMLCDQLEQQTEASIEAHATLVEVLLATLTDSTDADELAQNWARISENFDSLFTTEQSIESLKQTVLQLAVMGKLVPQNLDDEPASVLLEKIAEEKEQLIKDKKIKKEKPLPAIRDDEKLFELPQGWEFSRLQQVIDVRDGTHDSPKDASGKNTFPLVTSKDFQDGSINFNTARRISKTDHIKISQRSSVDYEDILFSMIGGNIGNQVIVLDTRPFSIKNVALFKYYNKEITIPKFVKLYTEFIAYQLQNSARGGAQPFVSLGYLRSLVFALPPAKEQHRIVTKVDELMVICDQLKVKLQQSQETQVQLTDALVDRALV